MPLVGDLIIDTRLHGPDLPGVYPAPTGLTLSSVAVSSDALPAGVYHTVVTYLCNWGETVGATEDSFGGAVTITAGHSIKLTGTMPPGVIGGRIYLTLAGGGTGTESQFFQFNSLPATVTNSTLLSGAVPALSSAWNPDTNGGFIAASTMYSWIRDALEASTVITGGVIDTTGIPSVQGQPMYVMQGRWNRFDDAFYDGYPIARGSRKDNYYRSPISSISWNCNISRYLQQATLELFAQPQRTAGQYGLTAPMAATDTSLTYTVNANGGFMLSIGIARVGGVNGELFYYSADSGTQLQGLTRGYGGTVAQAWPIGSVVDECNINLQGKRYPIIPTMGQALNNLDVPAGWFSALQSYMLYRYRKTEQELEEAQAEYKSFEEQMVMWRESNKPLTGPKQAGGPSGIEVFYPSPLGHGWIVP